MIDGSESPQQPKGTYEENEMHDDPRVHMAPDNMSASRELTHEVLYQAARRLRDRAAAIEKLADEVKRRTFEPAADDLLWEMALGLFSSRV